MTFKSAKRLTVELHERIGRSLDGGEHMKAELIGLMAVAVAVLGTTGAAATKVAANGGCCPLCK